MFATMWGESVYAAVAILGLLAILIASQIQAHTTQEKDVAMNKWLELVKLLAPAILSTIPGVPAALIPAVVMGVSTAEQIPGATGEQKKAAVLAEVQIGLNTTNAIRPNTIDTATTVAAVAAGIDAVVGGINAIHSVHQTLPPAPPVV